MFASIHHLGVWFRLLLTCLAITGAAPAVATPVVDPIELRAEGTRAEREGRRSSSFEAAAWPGFDATPSFRSAPRVDAIPRLEPWRPWTSRRLFIVQRALLV